MKQLSFPDPLRKIRNLTLYGVRTSIGLEPEMWRALEDVARRERLTLTRLIESIDARRLKSGDEAHTARLTPAIRVFLLKYYRDIAEGGKPSTSGTKNLRGESGFAVPSTRRPVKK